METREMTVEQWRIWNATFCKRNPDIAKSMIDTQNQTMEGNYP